MLSVPIDPALVAIATGPATTPPSEIVSVPIPRLPMFNPKVLLSPSFAVVLQNITALDFGVLGKIPQQLNVGAAVNPNFWIIKTTFAVEVDDLTKNVEGEKDLYKRTHLGAEFRFPKILAIRAGISEGYLTAGIGIDLWIVAINYATYAEELGVFSGQRADRRHVAQVSLGF